MGKGQQRRRRGLECAPTGAPAPQTRAPPHRDIRWQALKPATTWTARVTKCVLSAETVEWCGDCERKLFDRVTLQELSTEPTDPATRIYSCDRRFTAQDTQQGRVIEVCDRQVGGRPLLLDSGLEGTNPVQCIEWAPGETGLAAGGEQGFGVWWLHGEPLRVASQWASADVKGAWTMSWSGSGQLLAAIAARGELSVWQAFAGECLWRSDSLIGMSQRLCWSPADQMLAACFQVENAQNRLALWRVTDGELMHTKPQAGSGCCFCPDRAWGLIAAVSGPDLNLRDVRTGKTVRSLRVPPRAHSWPEPIDPRVCHWEGYTVATGHFSPGDDLLRVVRLWDLFAVLHAPMRVRLCVMRELCAQGRAAIKDQARDQILQRLTIEIHSNLFEYIVGCV